MKIKATVLLSTLVLGAAVQAQREVGDALQPLAQVAAAGGLHAQEAPPQQELQQAFRELDQGTFLKK